MINETLFDFFAHAESRTTIVLIGIMIVVVAFIFSVLRDRKDNTKDHESLQHSKSIKVGVLSVLIGLMICVGIDFSGE